MFVLKVSIHKPKNLKYQNYQNYPKYIVSYEKVYIWDDIVYFFYYVVSEKYIHFELSNNKCKIPTYFITNNLYFNLHNTSEKFNLSKLGTDYIVNSIFEFYKKECIGSYPDKYIFVNEPDWPYISRSIPDKTPLKKFKGKH